MMTVLELTVVVLYMLLLGMSIAMIQILQLTREERGMTVKKEEDFLVQSELEEPDSDEEKTPFDPQKEDYAMTENPMLRHRNVETPAPAVEEVD
jgi:hypothetical protein